MVPQLLHGHFAYTPHATNNDMTGQLIYFLFQTSLVKCVSVFSIDKVGRQGGNRIGKRTQTSHDQDRGEQHSILAQVTDLLKPHSGHCDDRHVQSLDPRVPFDHDVSHTPQNDHPKNKGEGQVNAWEHSKGEHVVKLQPLRNK